MKKITKFICIILAALMAFSGTSVALAKQKVTPVIVMHGLGGADLFNNYGTSEQSMIAQYGLDTDSMLKNQTVMQEAVKLLDNGRNVNYNKLFGELGKILGSTGFNCTANGNPQKGQGIDDEWYDSVQNHMEYLDRRNFSINSIAKQVVREVGAKNVYAFNYDWRLDMQETAKKLRKLVVTVKKKTHAKKVTIVGMSLGGAVISAYMDAYKKYNDVEKYVFVNGAQMGLDTARLFRLDFTMDKKSVLAYLKHLEKSFEGGARLETIRAIRALGDARIGIAVNKLNKQVCKNPKRRKQFYLTVMKPWLANCPSPWECIPYGEFNACVKQMSKIGVLNKKSGLYKKIVRYHKIQGRFKKNVKWAKKHGAQTVFIANYGTRALPLTSKKNNHTDLIIDTKYASGGATVAQFGKKVKGSGKYVSPDRIINASSCVSPESTWFFKYVSHGIWRYNTQATKFLARIITFKGKCTVKSVKKKYKKKQFIVVDKEQKIKNV
ncbi:MAG: hypothetical protein IJ077_01265 [Eubacterium sp.]|nr:hypothetical protein [Eubacterium sp.]